MIPRIFLIIMCFFIQIILWLSKRSSVKSQKLGLREWISEFLGMSHHYHFEVNRIVVLSHDFAFNKFLSFLHPKFMVDNFAPWLLDLPFLKFSFACLIKCENSRLTSAVIGYFNLCPFSFGNLVSGGSMHFDTIQLDECRFLFLWLINFLLLLKLTVYN